MTDLTFESIGDGPPVVLIEGAFLDMRMWDEQVGPLSERYRVIRYDVRGIGRTPHTSEPFQNHEDLLELIDHLDAAPAHLVGLSLGGRIAIDFALEHPDAVRSLVLAAPGLSGFVWPPDEHAEPIRQALEAGDPIGAADQWLEHPYMVPAMEHAHLRDQLRTMVRGSASLNRNTELELDPPAVGRLHEIDAPTLVLVGTRDVADMHTIADRLTSEIAGARRIDFDGAGHVLNMEQPERFNREVLAFLDDQGS